MLINQTPYKLHIKKLFEVKTPLRMFSTFYLWAVNEWNWDIRRRASGVVEVFTSVMWSYNLFYNCSRMSFSHLPHCGTWLRLRGSGTPVRRVLICLIRVRRKTIFYWPSGYRRPLWLSRVPAAVPRTSGYVTVACGNGRMNVVHWIRIKSCADMSLFRYFLLNTSKGPDKLKCTSTDN